MILIETHLHNSEVSPCGLMRAEEIPKIYKDAGYQGIVVTNHFSAYVMGIIEGDTRQDRVRAFLNGSKLLVDAAKRLGLKAFLGAEVTLARYQWQDYLIYGDIEEGFLKHPMLHTYTQAQLFEVAQEFGWAVFQAHPFRMGCTVGDPKYMHGIEVYNGNHNSKEVFDRSINFCQNNDLKMIAGGDFHNIGQEGRAGIYIPEDIEDERQLAQYLLNNQPELFMINKY
ncbi:MAG TPA: PHP domain-containing protein [Clostridia bacterium]